MALSPTQKHQWSLVVGFRPALRTELVAEVTLQSGQDAEPELVQIRTWGVILYGEQCEEQREGSMLVNAGCPSLCHSLCRGARR